MVLCGYGNLNHLYLLKKSNKINASSLFFFLTNIKWFNYDTVVLWDASLGKATVIELGPFLKKILRKKVKSLSKSARQLRIPC